jgi:hypothetical protein
VVVCYRPPVPTTGTHFAILFQTSASEEKVPSGAILLPTRAISRPERTKAPRLPRGFGGHVEGVAAEVNLRHCIRTVTLASGLP